MLLVVVLLTYRSVPWAIWHDKPVVTIEGIVCPVYHPQYTRMAVFSIALFVFLYPLLFFFTLSPFSFTFFIFTFISSYWQVNPTFWHRGRVVAQGVTNGVSNSGYKPIFQCIGMGYFCRSCRVEINGRGLGSEAPCHVSYRGLFGGKVFSFVVSQSGRRWTCING